MKRVVLAFLAIIALSGAMTAATAQVQVVAGQTGSNAYYRIEVPPSWNGHLVIWNHGFTLSEPSPLGHLDMGPLVDVQLMQGYAVAASSYRLNGWALTSTNTDLKNLFDVFSRRVGTPASVIVTGGSLGGIVTIQAVERGNIGNVVGALSVCGANAGSRNWDAALDLRLTYDAICGDVPGAAIPGGAKGLPANTTFTPAHLGAALAACFPPTAEGVGRLVRFTTLNRIPASFVGQDMGYVTFGMANLVHDPRKLSGKVGVSNDTVDYGDALTNATVARVAANPGAAHKLAAAYTPTGDTRGAKIVSLHTDKDGLVVVENQGEYARLANPADFTGAVVVEAVPTHCGFTPAETLGAWESLRRWLATGQQPSPLSIHLTCQAVQPLVGGDCRIDPGFVIPPIDSRIRPRQD